MLLNGSVPARRRKAGTRTSPGYRGAFIWCKWRSVKPLFLAALAGGDAGDLGNGDAEALGDGGERGAGSASAADRLDLGIGEAGLVIGGAPAGRRPAGEAHRYTFPAAVTTLDTFVRW